MLCPCNESATRSEREKKECKKTAASRPFYLNVAIRRSWYLLVVAALVFYFRSFRAKWVCLSLYSVYQSCQTFRGRLHTTVREMVQPNIFVSAVNSIESTFLHCVGASSALLLVSDLSYFNSPIYLGILEREEYKEEGDKHHL